MELDFDDVKNQKDNSRQFQPASSEIQAMVEEVD